MNRKISEARSEILKNPGIQFSKFQTTLHRTYPFARNINWSFVL